MPFKSTRYLLSFFFVYLMELSLPHVNSFKIETYDHSLNKSITVFTKDQSSFNFNYTIMKCCQISNLYHMSFDNLTPIFNLLKDNWDNLLSDNITIFLNKDINKTVIPNISSKENNTNNITMTINDICNSQHNSNTTTVIKLKRIIVTVEFHLNETQYQFDYVQLCNDENQKKYTFTFESIINSIIIITLVAFMVVFVYLITYMTSDTALLDKQDKKTIELEWWYGYIIVLIGIFTSLFLYFFPKLTIAIISFVIVLILIGVIYITGVYYIKHILHIKRIPINLKELIKRRTFQIKRYRFIAFIISLFIVLLWSFYHNWIVLNILLYSLLFAANELISYKEYSNLILFSSCFLSYDIYWFLTQFYFKTFYTLKTLEAIDQPIKLVLPKFFNNDLLHPCYFISFIDIVIISYLIKYSKCFDVIKGNTSFVYYKISLMLLSIGSFMVIIIELFVQSNQIFLFPIELLLISGMIVATAYNKDFRDFWYGKNIQGLQKVFDDIISNDFNQIKDKRDITYQGQQKYEEKISEEDNDS